MNKLLKEVLTNFWFDHYGKTYSWKMNERVRQEIEELAKKLEKELNKFIKKEYDH